MVLNKCVRLENIESEKYGRLLADVYIGDINLNKLLLEERYADKLDDEARRLTDVIKRNTAHMGGLIDDLLSFSRMGRKDIFD